MDDDNEDIVIIEMNETGSREKTLPLDQLSDKIFHHILSYLNLTDLIHLSETSRNFREKMINSHTTSNYPIQIMHQPQTKKMATYAQVFGNLKQQTLILKPKLNKALNTPFGKYSIANINTHETTSEQLNSSASWAGAITGILYLAGGITALFCGQTNIANILFGISSGFISFTTGLIPTNAVLKQKRKKRVELINRLRLGIFPNNETDMRRRGIQIADEDTEANHKASLF